MRILEQALQLLRVRPGEAPKVALMFAYLLLVVTTIIMGRITRDALFVTAFDEEYLAYMYVTVALIVPAFSWVYARVADKFRRDRIIIATLTIGVVSMVITQALVLTGNRWVYAFLYNWVEVVGAFLIIQFWTFAGDIFSSREAKRLFPIVGGGGILASMICGVAVSAAVKGLGVPTQWLLTPQIAALALCIAIVSAIGQRERTRLQEAIVGRHTRKQRSGGGGEVKEVFQSKHLRLIAGMTVATFLTVPLIDYQFKILAKEAFTSAAGVVNTDGISSFMGIFYSATGVIAAVMQLTLTGRLLERFGVVVSLLVLPMSLLAGTFGMAIGLAAFSMSVFAKGAENSFRYSIYDATMQVIYTPVPGHLRGRAKTLIDGVLKPWAGGVAGLTIALFVDLLDLRVTRLSFVALACTAVWILFILRIRGEYVTQLLASLRRRRLDFSKQLSINDEKTVDVLIRALSSGDETEVRHSLELVPRIEGRDVSDEILPLLDHPASDIQIRALQLLGASGSFEHADRVLSAFAHEDGGVRAAAIRAYCAIVGEPARDEVAPFLESDAPEVRGAAVAGLMRHGGLESVLVATETLKSMQTHEDEPHRFAAALVFGEIAIRNFFQPVLALMNDSSQRVQTAAIAAAGAMRAQELIPALIYKLDRPETARAASLALADFGESVAETLGKVLSHDPESVTIRRQVPRILERIGSPRCLVLLTNCLAVKDPDTRGETAHAAARLRNKLEATVDEERVKHLLDEEVADHYQLLAALADLSAVSGEDGPDLLRDAITERLARSFQRIFRFLGILYPLRSIELIYTSLTSQNLTARSNAVEVLDNLLDKDLKRRVLPMVEDLPAEKVLQRGAEHYEIVRREPIEWIKRFLTSRDPWLVVVALHLASELGLAQFEDEIFSRTNDRDPVARETAIKALAVIAPAEEFLEAVEPLVEDPAPSVRRYAAHMVAQYRAILPATA
jgi:AAA family ATP:ADP antiporter